MWIALALCACMAALVVAFLVVGRVGDPVTAVFQQDDPNDPPVIALRPEETRDKAFLDRINAHGRPLMQSDIRVLFGLNVCINDPGGGEHAPAADLGRFLATIPFVHHADKGGCDVLMEIKTQGAAQKLMLSSNLYECRDTCREELAIQAGKIPFDKIETLLTRNYIFNLFNLLNRINMSRGTPVINLEVPGKSDSSFIIGEAVQFCLGPPFQAETMLLNINTDGIFKLFPLDTGQRSRLHGDESGCTRVVQVSPPTGNEMLVALGSEPGNGVRDYSRLFDSRMPIFSWSYGKAAQNSAIDLTETLFRELANQPPGSWTVKSRFIRVVSPDSPFRCITLCGSLQEVPVNRGYRFQPGFAFVSSILLAAIVLLCSSIPLHAAQAATTKVRHKPIPYFVAGSRIAIDAKVTDESGVSLVRCYFKADMQAEYVFVPMQESGGRDYRAVLPAPADYAEQIEYLFLVVNNNRQVVKSQEFQVNKALDKTSAPDWQKIDAEETIRLYTELPAQPETIPGFSDSVTMDAVESSLRFGMVAGVYSSHASGSAGSVTGAAASSTSAGSITAATGAYTTIALATIAGVAAGAGAIAVSGGGGGSSSKAAINPSARITWGDENVLPADTFQAIFGREDLGSASGTRDKSGLPVGVHNLTIRAVSITGEFGNVVVVLGGGAYFQDDGGTRKTARLTEGQSIVFPVFVPETGSGRIEW